VALIVNPGVAAATASESGTDWVCTGLDESVTVKVKLAVPVAVGLPEITPAAKLSPAGSVPEVTDQVYVPLPPVALSVAL
jgi:hypothetical protein